MKALWIVGGVFFVLGIGLLFGGVAWWRSNAAFAAHAASAEGTVSDLVWRRSSKGNSGTYVPVVDFSTADGRRIHVTGSGGSNPPAYARGEKVRVLYDAANPEHAQLDTFSERHLGPAILSGLGAVFALVGGGVLAARVRQRKQRAWLAQNGLRVKAKFDGVDYDTSVRVNGRSPWRLTCQWQHPATQKVYVFRSDAIWFDPAPYVQRDTLDVLVNADDPRQYQVDLSFLPKSA